MSFLLFYQVITTSTLRIGSSPWCSKHFAVIRVGNIGSYQTTALFGRFYYNCCFGKTGDNPIPLQKISFVKGITTPEFGIEPTVFFHFFNVFFMLLGVDLIQPMGQTPNGLQIGLNSSLMCTDIYAIGQT